MTGLTNPKKEGFLLVKFSYGATGSKTLSLFTDRTSDTDHESNTYSSVPAMDVSIPKYTGVFKEKSAEIILPLSETFADEVSDGRAWPKITVTIYEYNQSEGVACILTLFEGTVIRTRRYHEGKPQVLIECVNKKSEMAFPLGIVCGLHCDNTFGGKGCDPAGTAIGLSSLKESGFVAGVSGNRLIITGLSAVADRYWHRGYVEYDGLRILIRDWESGTVFQLARPAPASWAGQTITVTPGCSKTVEECRDLWDNEEHFAGSGYAMPDYQPIIETS